MKKSLFLLALFLSSAAFAAPAGPAPVEAPVVLKERPVRLPPLFWYERDREAETRLVMAAMVYWDVRDGDTAHHLFFPFFYRWREADRSFLFSLPLVLAYSRPGDRWMLAGPFFRRRDEEMTTTLLFPLYLQRIRPAGGRVTTALPFVLYDYRSRDRRNIDTVFPVGFLRRRGDMTMGLVGPYFWQTDPESRFRVLFPLSWHGRSPESRFDVLVPFYHVWTADDVVISSDAARPGHEAAGLFPLVGAGWGNGHRSHYLFPLYYYAADGDRRDFLSIPFSSFRKGDGRRGHVGLYFYNHDPDLSVNGVFPLFYRRRSTDGFESKTQVLNFYYSRENDEVFHTLFPLYGAWRTPQSSTFLSWGYWSRRDEDGAAGWSLLYFWKSAANGDRNRVFFPLFWSFKRAPDWSVDVLFPLYTRYRDGDTTVTAIPPVIIRRSPGHRSISLFFLYWSDREGDRGVTTMAPFFLSQYNPRRKSLFSPLLWTRRSPLSREGIFPPVYWYRSAEARRTIVFPVYWDFRTASRRLWILPPAYKWRKDDVTEIGFFPLWGRRTAEVTKDGVSHREPRGGYLFPFYWSDIDGKGNGTWIIPSLLGYVAKSGAGTADERFSMQYLLLGSIRKDRDGLEHGFFPLYQYVRKGDTLNWWAPRIVALAAYERRGADKRGVVFPYFWWRAPAVDRDMFLPLYYHSRRYQVDSSTVAAPARGEAVGGATMVFPLWWSGREREHRYTYFIPFFARDREGARRWTAVFPLWVSYQGLEDRKFVVLFPLYWHYRSALLPAEEAVSADKAPRPDRRDVAVAGPFYRVDTWRDGRRTRTVGFAPLFARTYTGPDDKYWEVLGGLFGRDVQAGRRRFRLLWIFYTPARPLPKT